jgi:hypothetical protein
MTDAELIENLGGPAKVCDLLKISKQGGVQRVQNWKVRGIPARVKVERPDLFLGQAPTVQPGVVAPQSPITTEACDAA